MKKLLMILSMLTWELPQSILALILMLVYTTKSDSKVMYKNTWVLKSKTIISGISLGRIIIINNAECYYNMMTIKHEYGHTIQSLIFGPLYLIVIGFFSLGNNIFWRKSWYGKKDYYLLYPEKWADKLGNVTDRKYRWQ